MKPYKTIACLVITSLFFLSGTSCKKGKKTEERPEISKKEKTGTTQAKRPEEGKVQEEEILKSIKKITNSHELVAALQKRDFNIRKAAIARLGEIGGEESVKVLTQTFYKEPRVAGTDSHPGIHGDIITALSRIGAVSARESIQKIIRSWLQNGPMIDGLYAHIYDSQYYAILNHAIDSLQAFPDDQSIELLKEIAGNPSLFYSLRESAFRILLKMELRREGIEALEEKISFLLSKIDTRGVLLENRWTGNTPGDKTLAAGHQEVVERLIIRSGFKAVGPLIAFLKKLNTDEPMKKLAASRMLSLMLVQELRKTEQKKSGDNTKNIALQIIYALGDLPEEHLSTGTILEIYGYLQASAEILADQDIWEELKKIRYKMKRPGEWQGEEPTSNELKLPLPQNSEFIAGFSRRFKTPLGILLKAYYFSNLTAEEIVKHFQKATGKKAREKFFKHGQIETSFTIKNWPAPQGVKLFMELGVTVFKAKDAFEEREFGHIVRTGKTMFCITRIQ